MNGVRVSTRLLIPGWMSEDRSTHEHPRVRRSVALYSPIDYQTGAIEYRGHPHPSRLPLEPVCRGWWGARIKNRLRGRRTSRRGWAPAIDARDPSIAAAPSLDATHVGSIADSRSSRSRSLLII